MSEKKSKTYTAEFKESAVKLAVESDQAVTETARDLGINTNLHDRIFGHPEQWTGQWTGHRQWTAVDRTSTLFVSSYFTA